MYRMKTGALALVFSMMLGTSAVADEMGDKLAALLDKTADSIATVKAVVKVEMMGRSNEERLDIKGVIVDASGLIMISNSDISADRMGGMLGGMGGGGPKLTPSDFKAVFGNEEKEYEAFLVAKDTELDLAFVQVKGLEDRQLTAVSFDEGAKLAVGQKIVSVSRMAKGFDYAPYFTTARISGKIKKPRKAWMIDGGVAGYGLPVFTADGQVLGVMITLEPTMDDDSGPGLSQLMRMFGGGGGGGDNTFLLPAKSVKRLVTQSIEKAKELETMQEDEKKEAEAGTEADAGGSNEG